MKREVTLKLKQIGYLVGGLANINLWGGGQGEIEMHPKTIFLNELSKDNLLRCVNDGGFGCESIEDVTMDIFDLFENNYSEFNRTIIISGTSHRNKNLFCKGIKRR